MTNSGPDFLGIGAQKAGTTWLWAQLKRHPSVWMPPRKELHYFDRNDPEPNYLSESSVVRRLTGKEKRHAAWREMCFADFEDNIRRYDLAELFWNLRFYFGTHDDTWYRSIFPRRPGRLTGEITPAYSILPEAGVAHITSLLPAVKVILLFRNPIERAWSQIRFDWTRGARQSIDDLDDLKSFVESPKQVRRSDYLRMLNDWEHHLPANRFFVGFYDDIVETPKAVLERVCAFLGLDIAACDTDSLRKKVHVSREAEIPTELHRYLANMYLPDLVRLEQRFGEPVTSWRKGAEQVLARGAVQV